MSRPARIVRSKSDAKAREIMDAGRRVMFREGIWNTTTRKIADEAGISLATIHYYFANKDDLLVAVYEEMIDSVRVESTEDFSAPSTLRERIEGVIERTWEFSRRHMEGQLMQGELTLYALRNGLQSLAVRQGREYLDIYVRVLGGASDVIARKDLDIEGLSQVVLAGIDGLLLAHLVEPDFRRSERNFKNLAQMALHYPLTASPPPITAVSLTGTARRGSRTPRKRP